MLRDFFRYEAEYPAGSGFALFGPCHLAWLFVIAVFIWVSTKWYCKKDREAQKRINYIMGFLLPLTEMYRDTVLIASGNWGRGFLPFHLCSMALVLACIYAFTGWRFVGMVYVLLCIPGAAAALLFPDWTAYPFFSYMHIHGFLAHGLTIAFGMWLFASKRVVIGWRDYWMPVAFGAGGMCVLYFLNGWLGTNFWFLSVPSKGSPLEIIWQAVGSMGYLAGYFVFCMLVVVLWQLVLIQAGKRKSS